MYAYFVGELREISEENVVLEVNHIGYNIRVSASTIQRLPSIGETVKLYTYTLVREDALSLYGFVTRDDLEIFKKLITVNGIGPKGGLAILSVLTADALRFAIMTGDSKSIAKAPGIGAKTAERVILDLKDKIAKEDPVSGFIEKNNLVDSNETFASDNKMKHEAIEALVALGYSANDATAAVKKVDMTSNDSVESILKSALKYIF